MFLPRGTVVRGGDVLVAEDGSMVRVIAAPQPVLVITHCSEHGTPFDLMRAAYHLGNRHVPIELKPDHLKIEPDHVLADMLRVHAPDRQGDARAAFEPEGGAYGAHGGHARMATMDTSTTITDAALLRLVWLASPALPVGGFSYSEGLEAAVEAGLVQRRANRGRLARAAVAR